MSLKKQYMKSKSVCRVTFALAKDIAKTASRVNLAGDFNNWDMESIQMKKSKSGDFSVSVELEKGKEYQFKYLVDSKDWVNDQEADKYVPNEFLGENSVVVV